MERARREETSGRRGEGKGLEEELGGVLERGMEGQYGKRRGSVA